MKNKTINWIGMFIGIILSMDSFLLIKWYPFTLFLAGAGGGISSWNFWVIFLGLGDSK